MEMNRSKVLAQYRPIRAGIQRILRLAATACNRADLTRGAKQIAMWPEAEELTKGNAPDMIVDVALFEHNQRGRRAYDRFLEQKAHELSAADRALAESMARAWFSIFRVAERHEAAGLWLEDLLDSERRLRLVDEGLEASATLGAVIGMRLFDAGPFHAGFGIVVTPDEDTTHFAVTARARGDRIPFRQSLAATLYGDEIRPDAPTGPVYIALIQDTLSSLVDAFPAHDPAPPHPAKRKKRPRSGKRTF